MIARLLGWFERHLPFLAADSYPDFDERMDAVIRGERLPAAKTITENWGSEVLKERGPRPATKRRTP